MAYLSSADPPPSVRHRLADHAQHIYRGAFNHPFAAHSADPREEQAAHRIAWAAVNRGYVEEGTPWVERR